MQFNRRLLQRGLPFLVAALLPASASLAADVALTPIAIPQVVADLPPPAEEAIDTAELECMAKVVLHEAGNQPHDGKVAVAQTLVNRREAGGRFGQSICQVANQPGQFFNTAAYNPDRDRDGWSQAVEVARSVLTGDADPVAPGAIFFRGSYAPTPAFFRTRQRVASIGAHVFYR